ncbi:unnamed protein product [Auanema sp. JU1783]|nr:unnamed protein product [Auanema sp. JU1783]
MNCKPPWRTRIINLKRDGENFASQVRVNIYYERDILETESPLSLPSSPPQLDIEAYHETPPWSGQEEVVANSSAANRLRLSSEAGQLASQPALVNPLKRSRTLSSNVLRFATIDEMSSYCAQNNITSGCHASNRNTNASSDETDGELNMDDFDQKNFVISIDEEYASKSLEYVSQQNRSGNSRSRFFSPMCMSVCRVCNMAIPNQKKKQHIYTSHLKKPLFRCPLCSFCNLYHKANVEIHIKRRHGVHLRPISLKEAYAKDIDTWLYICFADRRILRCIDPDVTQVVSDLVDWVAEGRSLSNITSIDPSTISIISNETNALFDPQQMPEDLLEPDSSDVQEEARVDDSIAKLKCQNTCSMCKMANVRHMERHVLQHHVRLPMFLCPFCPYSSNYAASSVKDHIRVKHSLTEQAQPIDLRDEHWIHIRKVYDRCFSSPIFNHNLKKDKPNKYRIPFVGK